MVKNKKILTVILLILLIASAAGNIHTICHVYNTILPNISAGIAIITVIFAIIYMIKGYSKDAAFYYKAFMVLSALFYQSLAISTVTSDDILPQTFTFAIGFQIGANCLLFGLFLLLCFGKDIGKKTTNFIGILSLIVTVSVFIVLAVKNPQSIDKNILGLLYSRLFSRIVFVITAYLLIQFKYIDKDERGTT